MAHWLQPTHLVEKISGGYFKLNDRNPANARNAIATWNDVEFPKTEKDVCSDKYRISKISCLFGGPVQRLEALKALQLEFSNMKNDEDVVSGPLVGVKLRNTPWTTEFVLEPKEHLLGINIVNGCQDIRLKTNTGKTVSMKSGLPLINMPVWELPAGFRIYGFHGSFEGNVLFLGPIFKAMEFKQWDQALYKELPPELRRKIELMLVMRNRHKMHPPEESFMNFWLLPEVVWDQIINQLLYSFYHDVDANRFFQGIQNFLTDR